MKLHTLVLVTLSFCVLAHTKCNRKTALRYVKQPIYEFSIRLLQRVAEETQSNFVFSPLTTWLQLSALSEGATRETYVQIQNVTKTPRQKCFKKKLKNILDRLDNSIYGSKRKSIIAIDKLLAVKDMFRSKASWFYGVDVLLLDFLQPEKSRVEVNNAVNNATGGAIDYILYDSDFNSTVLLMSDANYFHSDWLTPFDSAYTVTRNFYGTSGGLIGEVSMMSQIGYFNVVDIGLLNAKVIEIPFAKDKTSMLIFLPTTDTWVGEIFYNLERTRIRGIFNLFKRVGNKKLISLAIPKFDIETEVANLPELLYDMGIYNIFYPEIAQFKAISRYPVYASLITQKSRIEVNEGGVTMIAGKLIKSSDDVETIFLDKPFAYMIVDKVNEFILYAGVYSVPENLTKTESNINVESLD